MSGLRAIYNSIFLYLSLSCILLFGVIGMSTQAEDPLDELYVLIQDEDSDGIDEFLKNHFSDFKNQRTFQQLAAQNPQLLRGCLNQKALEENFYNSCFEHSLVFGNRETLQIFFEDGVDLEAKMGERRGRTPLFFSCSYCSLSSVEFLLDMGVDPNQQMNC